MKEMKYKSVVLFIFLSLCVLHPAVIIAGALQPPSDSALLAAVKKGDVRQVKNLLEDLSTRNEINRRGYAGDAPLRAAAQRGNPEIVELLIEHGADIQIGKESGERTPLMDATDHGHAEIVKYLISKGADIDAADKYGNTAMIIACEKGYTVLVRAFLKAGADITKKTKYGDTALVKAIAGKHQPIAKMLIKHHPEFDRKEALGAAIVAGDIDIARILLTREVDVNERRFKGGTLLMLAADDPALIKFLIEKGADVNAKDDDGETALMKAVASYAKTNLSCVNLLLAKGADINAVNSTGETPLIMAVKKFNVEMAALLLKKGSSADIKDKKGKSAWTYAFESDSKPMLSLLEKAHAAKDYNGMEWKGNVCKQSAEFIKVIDNPSEWSNLWERAFEKAAPDLNFEKYAVACVFLGYSADWLYSISIGQPVRRDGQLVIPYALFEVMLRLNGPFKAGGQYHMKIVEKAKDVQMILHDERPFKRKRVNSSSLLE